MALPEQRLSALRCSSCERPLRPSERELRCVDCAETVPVTDGVPRFPVGTDQSADSTVFDSLASVYETPLWFPVLYRFAGGPLAPLDDRTKLRALLDAAGRDVLDVACGTGRFTRDVADQAAFTWGIDISDEMLRKARRYVTRNGVETAAFARMAADDIRFDADEFDGVACCWALHLFADPAAALSEIRRVLRPTGRFVGTTLTDDYVLALPWMQEGVRQTIGGDVFERAELRAMLQDAGFDTVAFERRGAALFFRAET